MGHKSHKSNHKKHHHSSNSFKHEFKYGFLGTASAIQSTGKELNKASPLLKPAGETLKGVGGIEKLLASSADAIGSKNPSKRFRKNMAISF
jgi:hypothetical protein